jgi:hypothetical protein
MPTIMSIGTFEYVITPETTYISAGSEWRRIFTDGRPWPTDLEPTYQGFSIGKWIDEEVSGVYDVLEVRPAARSRDLAFTTRRDFRWLSTMSRRSRKESFWIRRTRTFCTT